MKLKDVSSDTEPRRKTGIAELDRVLGGGVVEGSLVLLGGDAQSFILVPSLLLIPMLDRGLHLRTAGLLLASAVLAFVIEKATGRTFADAVRKYVYEPAGMA